MKLRASLIAAAIAMFAGTSAQAALLVSDDFTLPSARVENSLVGSTSVTQPGGEVTVGSVTRTIGTSLTQGTYSSAIVNGDLLFSGDASVQSAASYLVTYQGGSLTGTTGVVSLTFPNVNFGSNPANINQLSNAQVQIFSGSTPVSDPYGFSSANPRPLDVSLAVTSPLHDAGLTVRVSSIGLGFDVAIDNLRYNSNSVPVPASLALMGLGLLGLGATRRKN